MKKTIKIIAALVGSGWLMAGVAGQQGGESSEKQDNYVNSVVDDIKAQAAEEIKIAFANEVEEFFKNDDLANSLGISSEEQGKLESSIKNYINSYSQDEEKLDEAKASVEKLLENADGLSVDELQAKISDIFKQ